MVRAEVFVLSCTSKHGGDEYAVVRLSGKTGVNVRMFDVIKPRICRFGVLIGTLTLAQGASTAMANDGVAALGTGGLVFEHTDRVQMASEILKISPDKIDVEYVFKNMGAEDATLTVAFPMPELDMMQLSGIKPPALEEAIKTNDVNFLRFETWVEGKKVEPEMEVRVSAKDGNDITTEFRNLKLTPLNPYPLDAEGSEPAIGKKLEALDAADVVENEESGRSDKLYSGAWKTQITYYWKQTFPAGKETRIRHSYRPVPGYTSMGTCGGAFIESAEWEKDYCPDRTFRKALQSRTDAKKNTGKASPDNDGHACLQSDSIQYILGTAKTWAGPIGSFTLFIDKGKSSLFSLCSPEGLKLVRSGKTFVATAKSFVPKEDLNILFVY